MIKYEPPNFMRNPFSMVSKQCIDLCKRMLIKDPSQRITSMEALQHPFFDILGDPTTRMPPSVFEVPQPPPSLILGASKESGSRADEEESKGQLNPVPEAAIEEEKLLASQPPVVSRMQ